MTAYVVGQLEIHDGSWAQVYGAKTDALIQKYGGRIITRASGSIESLEGEGTVPSAVVILEFPSKEQAKAWYTDPEYADMIRLRRTGSDAEILLLGPVE